MNKRMNKRLTNLVILSMVLSAVSVCDMVPAQAETYEGKTSTDKVAIAVNVDKDTIGGTKSLRMHWQVQSVASVSAIVPKLWEQRQSPSAKRLT